MYWEKIFLEILFSQTFLIQNKYSMQTVDRRDKKQMNVTKTSVVQRRTEQ